MKRRALVSHQPVTVDLELVALGFAAEDRVIVQHQAGHAGTRPPVEDQRRGQTADAAADDDAVVRLAGLDCGRGKRVEDAVPDLVRLRQHIERVAVRGGVVADSPRTVPVLRGRRLREQLQRIRRRKARAGRQQRRIQEIPARDGLVQPEGAVLLVVFRGEHLSQRPSSATRGSTGPGASADGRWAL